MIWRYKYARFVHRYKTRYFDKQAIIKVFGGQTLSLQTLAVRQLYLTASPVQTYKLSIFKNIRVAGTKALVTSGFAIQKWS